jgi:hypothetical protein
VQESLAQVGTCAAQVLTGVEHEEAVALAELIDQRFEPALTALLGQPAGRHDRLRHERGLGKWREIDPLRVAPADELAGETCFADSTGPNERQQPRAGKLRREGREQPLAPKQHARV